MRSTQMNGYFNLVGINTILRISEYVIMNPKCHIL